jgi:hypothetical protein
MEHTKSYCFLEERRDSAGEWMYVREEGEKEGSAEACAAAIEMFDLDASIPVVCAPNLARLYIE